MRADDKRRTSHRKGVAIGHTKTAKRTREVRIYTLEQMRRDVNAGWNFFWSNPKRKHLKGDML